MSGVAAVALWVAAWLLLWRLRPGSGAAGAARLVALGHLVLAATAGAVVTLSCLFANHPPAARVALAAVAAAGAVALARACRGTPVPAPASVSGTSGRQVRSLEALLWAGIAIGLATALARVLLLPLDWDGWAIWQLKARGLAEGDLPRQLGDIAYRFSHPDYPLLVPAHTWLLAGGRWEERAAQWGGLLFLLDLLALCHSEARRLAGPRLALAGSTVLLSWPLVMKHTASGFADLPLAAFVLAVGSGLSRGEAGTVALGLAGAVLTKNEGLFPLGAAVVVLCLPGAIAGGIPPRLRFLAALLPAALLAASWSVVRHRWGLFADLLDPANWSRSVLADLGGRAAVIARGYLAQALQIGPRYPGWGLLWPALAWAAARAGVRRARGETIPRELAPWWVLIGAHWAGAAVAYLVTAADPALHLDRSLDRLWLHVAAPALLVVLAAVRAALEEGKGEVEGDAGRPG